MFSTQYNIYCQVGAVLKITSFSTQTLDRPITLLSIIMGRSSKFLTNKICSGFVCSSLFS